MNIERLRGLTRPRYTQQQWEEDAGEALDSMPELLDELERLRASEASCRARMDECERDNRRLREELREWHDRVGNLLNVCGVR